MSPTRKSAAALVGTVLEGAYRIEGLLAKGGMGTVYEATQLRLDKRVAVKLMAPDRVANPEALARFRREAEVTSRLRHPHIVYVHDFGMTPTGEPFLIMELLEGESLDRRLQRIGRLPAAEVVRIVKQVAAALAATHAEAIVHRDLKPANVYLARAAGEDEFVKVLDFGISKVRSDALQLTHSSSLVGTPHYMSPEQARGRGEDIDERADQWALACMTWECLCGEKPFTGQDVPSVLFQVVHTSPPALLPKVPGLAPQVEAVLLRALAKDRHARFASVTDYALALETAVTGSTSLAPSAASPAEPAHAAGASPPADSTQTLSGLHATTTAAPPRWRRPIWVGAAGLAMALLLGLPFILRYRSGGVAAPAHHLPEPSTSTSAAAVPKVPPPTALSVPIRQPAVASPASRATAKTGPAAISRQHPGKSKLRSIPAPMPSDTNRPLPPPALTSTPEPRARSTSSALWAPQSESDGDRKEGSKW